VTEPVLFLPARAKLNLVLRITGRRADGYHLLHTLFHEVELHDELWAARSDGPEDELVVRATDPRNRVEPTADNLVLRAVRLFRSVAGSHQRFRIVLHKHVPHGGGLGGGSSDAAAALRLCNALCGHPVAAGALQQASVALGADVPFFFHGGSQWGSGIGDELAPATTAPRHFLLVVPPFGCPTAEVYKNHAAHLRSTVQVDTVPAVSLHPARDSEGHGHDANDLEAAAERVRPELAGLRRRIAELGFPEVRMTGSGSTLFLGFRAEHELEAAAQSLGTLQRDGIRLLATRSAEPGPRDPVQSGWPTAQ